MLAPNRLLLLAVALLFIAQFAFATFSDNLSIMVIDQVGRPVPNATVYVTYQRDSVKGEVTNSKPVDAYGMANFTIVNTEYVEGNTDTDVVIRALYGYKGAVVNAVVYQHPKQIVMTLELYRLDVRLQSQRGAPLRGRVSVQNFTSETDSIGMASYRVPPGDTVIISEFSNGQSIIPVTIAGDDTRLVTFNVYNPTVTLVDDNGEPVNGYVTLLDQIVETDGEGKAAFANYVGDVASFTAQCSDFKQVSRADLTMGQDIVIIFDNHPPTISDIAVERIDEHTVRVRAYVADAGIYASGMGEFSNIYVDYMAGPRGGRETMYLDSNGIYEAELDVGLADSVNYVIYAIDNIGNKNFVSGNVFIVSLGQGGNGTNNTNDTIIVLPPVGGDGQNGSGVTIFGFNVSWVALIGVVVLLAVVGFVAYMYLTKQ